MNEEAQVEENLSIASGALAGSLTAAEIDLVGVVGRKYREVMKVGCTGCGYCQPCPSGVDIPGAFDLFNAFHTFGKTREAGFMYAVRAGGILSGRPAYASLCSQCRDCIEKCPQGLQIPDLLEQVAREFEGEGLKEREAMARRFFNS